MKDKKRSVGYAVVRYLFATPAGRREASAHAGRDYTDLHGFV